MSSPAPLSGKVALVTGGSKGIGASLSTKLASLGATVVINYSSDSQAANNLLTNLNNTYPSSSGSEHSGVQADASSLSGADQIISATVSQHSKIDILILCAGVLPMKDISSTSEADFDRTFALNVKGPYFLTQKALPHFPASGGGRIVLFSTTLCHASTVAANYLLYNSTKGAVEQMTRVLAKDPELTKKNITVNCAAPGPTATDLFLKGKSEEILKKIGSLNPHGRIGTPDEVAEAISLLVRDEGAWVTGQILPINGGMA